MEKVFLKNSTYIMSAILLILSVFFGYSYKEITRLRDFGKDTKFIVEHNESYGDVYDHLVEKGYTSCKIYARIAMRYLQLKGQHIVPGEYKIKRKCSLFNIINKLCSGDVIIHNIIIWRGQCAYDIKQMFNDRNDLIGELTENFSDGDLMAGKYEFKYPMSKNTMIKLIKQKNLKQYEDMWNKRTPKCVVKTLKECIILASIIAKEALLSKDIKLVSSVFRNRMNKGIKLQSCPTVIYPLTNGTFKGKTKLSYKDIEIESPYNTYKYYGLPPSPIAAPSEEDIQAVIDPVESEYIYFLNQPDNPELFFSKTYKEHCDLKKEFYK